MISRTSLLAFMAAGAIAACGGSQQQQQANTPPNQAMNAQAMQTYQTAPPASASELPNADAGVSNQTSSADRAGEFGVSGAAGPEQSSPGVADAPVSRSVVGVTNEQPAASPDDVASLNDAQLAALVIGIHEAEIKQGEVAESNASSPTVKRLAEHMVGAHRALLANDRTVLARDRISPATSAFADQKKGDAEGQLAALQSLHGTSFDAAYVDGQVRGHREALHLLDRIAANVHSADFKSDLQAERTHIEDHLRQAERARDMQAAQTTTVNPAAGVDIHRTHSQDFADAGSK